VEHTSIIRVDGTNLEITLLEEDGGSRGHTRGIASTNVKDGGDGLHVDGDDDGLVEELRGERVRLLKTAVRGGMGEIENNIAEEGITREISVSLHLNTTERHEVITGGRVGALTHILDEHLVASKEILARARVPYGNCVNKLVRPALRNSETIPGGTNNRGVSTATLLGGRRELHTEDDIGNTLVWGDDESGGASTESVKILEKTGVLHGRNRLLLKSLVAVVVDVYLLTETHLFLD
jgi:hypothetical protein